MIGLSALLVFGTAALVVLHMSAQGGELYPGFQQMIHARVPWLLLGGLWLGGALGVASIVRRRRLYKFLVVALELPLVAFGSWYFLSASYLPPHELKLGVGDAFPSYALRDHDGVVRRVAASAPREPALYIFYRGDW